MASVIKLREDGYRMTTEMKVLVRSWITTGWRDLSVLDSRRREGVGFEKVGIERGVKIGRRE